MGSEGGKKLMGKIKLLQVHVGNHWVTPLKLYSLDVVPGWIGYENTAQKE